ncbi:hypothetical protein PTTG_28371 [Puccinia triticina 1-1 BBBD Race 1]|uniref:Uncharacterized protein n=1 Tax=Puccinia triticina (isolate 1-1 / race 1 (BBBD)) TaxID=630390 RepID=A0A180GEH9_PUCT1|nr:hypothetical protein PTTG_28371 [Puccinia triticina 1-1 BBBD Race 1]
MFGSNRRYRMELPWRRGSPVTSIQPRLGSDSIQLAASSTRATTCSCQTAWLLCSVLRLQPSCFYMETGSGFFYRRRFRMAGTKGTTIVLLAGISRPRHPNYAQYRRHCVWIDYLGDTLASRSRRSWPMDLSSLPRRYLGELRAEELDDLVGHAGPA